MSYRRALLVRWSRRDRLAVLLVAVTVAFLTGTTLVVVAMGAQTTAIAAEFDAAGAATYHDDVAAARAATTDGGVVVPVARARVEGSPATLVGPPAATWNGLALRAANGTTSGATDTTQNVTLAGDEQLSTAVAPGGRTVFPPEWYVTDPATVRRLGVDGALAFAPADGVPARGVPLRGALPFFLAGTREALTAFGVAAGVGGVLVAVTAYSVTRLAIRDRLATIRIVRATGATPRQVASLLVGRTLLLLGVGVAAGYAVGVAATNALVTAAVVAGVPTSIDVGVSPTAVRVLLPTYAVLLGLGAVAALVGARSAVSVPPGHVGADAGGSSLLPAPLSPGLLDPRTVVPTAATLSAFVVFVLLVAGLAGVVGPLAGAEGATVTEPGAVHPIASSVPASYADALTARGIPASPEILLFEVRDGQPFPARGANFSAFAAVSGATLASGRTPTAPDEAVIGRGLSRTLDVSVGDTLTLGGSTNPAVTRVEVVGTFDGPGPTDDQLVVPLSTARHLSGRARDRVQFIRAERLPAADARGERATVLGVDAPATVAAGDDVAVRVRIRNDGLSRREVSRRVRFAGETRVVEASVPAAAERTVTATFEAPAPGDYAVQVDDRRRPVTVLPRDALRLGELPERAPPGSEPLARVENASGAPVENATVRVGDRTRTTGADGRVRLPLGGPGTATVTATAGDRRTEATVAVVEEAPRSLAATVRVEPERPSVFAEPTVAVTLSNPWNRTLRQDLTIDAPGGPYHASVELDPGGRTRLDRSLPRRPPGSYDVTVVGERDLAATDYRVVGDDRIVASLATGGRRESTGIGQAVQVAFGNVQVAIGALLALGAVMAVGGTASTFAGAVHARRRTVGVWRATGADPLRVVRLVVADALRVGALAALLGVVAGVAALAALAAAGVLVVYGVRVPAVADPAYLLAAGVGAILLTVAGAVVATLGLIRVAPARLLADDGRRDRGERRE